MAFKKEKNRSLILGLFFTFPVSLETWQKKGLLDREILIYKALVKKQYLSKVIFFTYGINDKKYQKYLGRKIVIVPMPKYFNFPGGVFLYSLLMPAIKKNELQRCDIYKTNQVMGSWVAILTGRIYQKPILLRSGYTISLFLRKKGLFKKIILNLVESFAYRYANYSTVSSSFDKSYLVNKFKKRNIEKIPNFIDTSRFRPLRIKKYKRRKIIFVGRFSKQKNIINLIRAVNKIGFYLDLYGGGGDNKIEVEKLINSSPRVRFKGSVANKQLPKILNKHFLFVLPSLYEGMPKALLEAMACGLPCLGANVRGINEVIKHGYNGWLVETDSENIKSGIIKLMSNSNLRKKLGQNARKTIEEKYSLEKILEKEVKIYNKLIK